MRQFIYTAFLILIGLTLISNSAGLGSAQGKGATGAPGDGISSCGNCHSNGAGNSSAKLTLIDQSGNETTQYVANEKYKVRLEISSSGTPSGYGFQMVSLFNGDNNDSGGFGDSAGDINVVSINGRKYAESNKILSSKVIEVDWTAPDSESNVTFYSAFNAVNGNGDTKGDDPGQVSLDVEAMSSSINDVKLDVSVAPNPCTDRIQIKGSAYEAYEIYDMKGVLRIAGLVSDGNQIGVQRLQPGLHFIILKNNSQVVYSMKFLKLD